MRRFLTIAVLITAASVCTSVFAQSRVPQSGNAQQKAVDLGLSVKWADRNLGASSPEGYGDYYAWGETSPKSSYSWSNLKYCKDDTGNHFSKYNTKSDYGPVDNKIRLDLSDDAARTKLGGKWRIPTDAEWTELREKCTWRWTSMNGAPGYLVTSMKTQNSIFLPAAGVRDNTDLRNAGSNGHYWSSFLNTNYPNDAWGVYFDSGLVFRDRYYRYYGLSVRPVSE